MLGEGGKIGRERVGVLGEEREGREKGSLDNAVAGESSGRVGE